MENNGGTNTRAEARPSIVLPWLQLMPFSAFHEQDGDSTDRPFDLLRIVDDIPPPGNRGDSFEGGVELFPRMNLVNQYESSRDLFERYRNIEEQQRQAAELQATLANADDDISLSISDLENLSINYNTSNESISHLYLTPSDHSEMSELSQTESEVYESPVASSSSTSNKTNVKVDDPVIMEDNVDDTCEPSQDQLEEENVEQSEEVVPNPLDNNMLLRACILDLNDVPMTAEMAYISNQMISILFNEREIEIVRHFLKYKINTTINEINERIAVLTRQQDEIGTQLVSIEDVDGENSNDSGITTEVLFSNVSDSQLESTTPPLTSLHDENATVEVSSMNAEYFSEENLNEATFVVESSSNRNDLEPILIEVDQNDTDEIHHGHAADRRRASTSIDFLRGRQLSKQRKRWGGMLSCCIRHKSP